MFKYNGVRQNKYVIDSVCYRNVYRRIYAWPIHGLVDRSKLVSLNYTRNGFVGTKTLVKRFAIKDRLAAI